MATANLAFTWSGHGCGDNVRNDLLDRDRCPQPGWAPLDAGTQEGPHADPQEPAAVRSGCAFRRSGRVGWKREVVGRAPHGANGEGCAGENRCGLVRVRRVFVNSWWINHFPQPNCTPARHDQR